MDLTTEQQNAVRKEIADRAAAQHAEVVESMLYEQTRDARAYEIAQAEPAIPWSDAQAKADAELTAKPSPKPSKKKEEN